MRKIQYHKLLLALPMLLLCTRTASAAVAFTQVTPVTVNYTLPATPGAAQIVSLKSDQDAGVFFTVTASSVPAWLTVTQYGTSGSGAVGKVAAASLSFQANAAAGAMLPGTYTQGVTFTTTANGGGTTMI